MDLATDPQAAILITHGLGEHCGRYEEWGSRLLKAGFSVFRYDLPGHGQSRSREWLFTDFDDLTAALQQQFQKASTYSVREKIPLFLFGHSMGGLVTADFVIRNPVNVAGVILSAPALDPGEVVRPWMVKMAGALRRIVPRLPILTIPAEHLSRNHEVVSAYRNDPLVYQGKIQVNTGYVLLDRMARVMDEAGQFQSPVLIIQGDADKIVRPVVSRKFFDRLEVGDKTWKSYPGMYHELLNDFGREEVVNDILHWLETRI